MRMSRKNNGQSVVDGKKTSALCIVTGSSTVDVDRCGYISHKMTLFVHRFDALWSHFFAKFVVLMSRLDAYISSYDGFCAHNDTIDYFTPCACAHRTDSGVSSSDKNNLGWVYSAREVSWDVFIVNSSR